MRQKTLFVILFVSSLGGTALAKGPWTLVDSKTGHLRSAVVREKHAVLGASSAVVLPEGFTPRAAAGGYIAGWFCPRCREGEEADWAVVNSSGVVVFRNPIAQWQLNQAGDGVTVVFDLPSWRNALPLLDLPASLNDGARKLVVHSCALPHRQCTTQVYRLGDASLQGFLAAAIGDVFVVCETQGSRFVARLQQGRIAWQTDVNDLLNPTLWDLNLQRGETLLGDPTLSSALVLDANRGVEVFRFKGPAEMLRNKVTLLTEAEAECRSRGGGAGARPLSVPSGFPEDWWLVSGLLRLESGRILAGGDLILLGKNDFLGLGLDCKGKARLVAVRRSKDNGVRVFSLAELTPEKRCEEANAFERSLQVGEDAAYVCCSEGCAPLEIPAL